MGAVEAITAAMHRHLGSARVQEHACGAMYALISSNKANKMRARRVGAQALTISALKAHPGNKRVLEEARNLMEHIIKGE